MSKPSKPSDEYDPPTAEGLFENAKSYAAAARRLVDPFDEETATGFYFLITFSIELSLKAACLHVGIADEVLRKEVRHDLHKAYCLAMDKGALPRLMTPFGQFVLDLRQHHLPPFVLRYTPRNVVGVEVLHPGNCMERLNELIAEVSALLPSGAKSGGLPPG